MTKDQLEHYLNQGKDFGYNTEVSQDIVGWIMISKRFPVNKFFERFTKNDNPELYKEQLEIKLEPYSVRIAEIPREVFEREEYRDNDDFLVNTSYTFKTLDEVESFLKEFNIELSQLKWTSELKFL